MNAQKIFDYDKVAFHYDKSNGLKVNPSGFVRLTGYSGEKQAWIKLSEIDAVYENYQHVVVLVKGKSLQVSEGVKKILEAIDKHQEYLNMRRTEMGY